MSQEKDPYNRGGYIAFLFSMIFSFGFFIYVSYMHPAIDLKEVKEAPVAGQLTLAQQVEQNNEPWVYSDVMAEYGKKPYKMNCALCHGDNGLGDGPGGAALPIKPRNLVDGGWKAGGTSIDLFKTVANGLEGTTMVAFKHLPLKDRWAMVHYIRSITKDKPADNADELAKFGASAE